MSISGNELFTVSEVAELCKVSPRTVFRWLSEGEMPAIRIGNVTRVRREDLDTFFQAHLTVTTKERPARRKESR